MKYWIITDTHFGHAKCREYCDRPIDCDERMIDNLRDIKETDVLIHLGDICIGNDAEWHKRLDTNVSCRKWLVKGNHDSKSASWYMGHGWDMVCRQLWIKRFDKKICFTHVPIADSGYDLNIHGHFHNSDHRRHEPELSAISNHKHRLVMVEHTYAPIALQDIVNR